MPYRHSLTALGGGYLIHGIMRRLKLDRNPSRGTLLYLLGTGAISVSTPSPSMVSELKFLCAGAEHADAFGLAFCGHIEGAHAYLLDFFSLFLIATRQGAAVQHV
jgi:hypothetical protein